jgi:hypothetical protein
LETGILLYSIGVSVILLKESRVMVCQTRWILKNTRIICATKSQDEAFSWKRD